MPWYLGFQECTLDMNFAGISNLELDLKIKKIIIRVNLGKFKIHKKSENSPY